MNGFATQAAFSLYIRSIYGYILVSFFGGEIMNKAQRRAHVEAPCRECGSRVIPTWKDERAADSGQPDWRVSARQCSRRGCVLDDSLNWRES